MDRYCVIGNPVEHSRSPWIHARFAQLTGQNLQYERCLAPLDGFAATVQALRAQGLRGCNVTVPFKFEAAALAAQQSPRVALAGACNTLILDGATITGDNTDGIGLVRDIEHNAQRRWRRGRRRAGPAAAGRTPARGGGQTQPAARQRTGRAPQPDSCPSRRGAGSRATG